MSLIADITNLILGVGGVLRLAEDTVTEGRQVLENTRLEIRRLKEFKFDPKWRTRVINVPAAIDKTHGFVLDMSQQIESALHVLISNLRAIHFAEEVGTISGGIGGTGQGHGVLKVLEDINKIKDVISLVKDFLFNLGKFVDAIRQIREELETLDTIFLPQGNRRRYIHATDGEVLKIRIGNLHKEQ